MQEAGPGTEQPDHAQLVALLAEIGHARHRLEVARGAVRAQDQLQLRSALLDALEAYASALASRGAPLPYRLRAEIDLYKGLGRRG